MQHLPDCWAPGLGLQRKMQSCTLPAMAHDEKLSLWANPALKGCTKPLLHYLRVWVEQAGQQPLLLLYY